MIDEKQMALGTAYGPGLDPTGWLVSEKMNGVRAYWDGNQLWTRGGKIIEAPESFTNQLPKGMHLDGELWAGRRRFEEARQAVQLGRWTAAMRFTAFDAPTLSGSWCERLEGAGSAWHEVVTVEVCADHRWLMERLRAVQGVGGEGLVIRHPSIRSYRIGRGAFLKVKETWPA